MTGKGGSVRSRRELVWNKPGISPKSSSSNSSSSMGCYFSICKYNVCKFLIIIYVSTADCNTAVSSRMASLNITHTSQLCFWLGYDYQTTHQFSFQSFSYLFSEPYLKTSFTRIQSHRLNLILPRSSKHQPSLNRTSVPLWIYNSSGHFFWNQVWRSGVWKGRLLGSHYIRRTLCREQRFVQKWR